LLISPAFQALTIILLDAGKDVISSITRLI